MKKIFNKLVRDKIPRKIEANGEVVVVRELEETEYQEELTRKLLEEVEEFQNDPSLEELADILEVIRYLSLAIGNSPEELEQKRLQKCEEKGGFEKRLFLVETN